jgi:hypothetical protein
MDIEEVIIFLKNQHPWPDTVPIQFSPDQVWKALKYMASRRKPQVQYSLDQQLAELIPIANREGLYDAADFLQNSLKRK